MVYRCPLCGEEFRVHGEGLVECPSCHARVKVSSGGGTAIDVEAQGRWPAAFIAVLRMSIAAPVAHFERVRDGRGWIRPWIYALVISAVVFFIAAAYQLGFQMLAASIEFAAEFANPFALVSIPFSALFLVMFAVIGVPVGTTLALLFQAAIYHICLMILGAAKRSFVDTFRVVCYAIGPQLFQVIPLFGGLVAWVWQIVLTIIGVKVVHDTSYGRSAVAVMLPMILCCGAIMLIGVTLAGWIFAAVLSASG